MLVNGAGSFSSVVSVSGLETLSSSAIVANFGELPATTQAALLMAILSAVIIPIGALVAGEGLAALALEQQGTTDFRETRWQEAAYTVVYRAVYARYMQLGLDDRDARKRATSEVKGYSLVQSYLDEHPQLADASINQVLGQLHENGIDVGRTTVAEVLQERRAAD